MPLKKFKDGHTGRNFVVEEPEFKFEAPKFSPKVDLPKASEIPTAKLYLEKRGLDPTRFYYTDKFKAWVNTLVEKFDNIEYDEPRIIIPLIYENQLIGFQGRALGPNSVKYITIMLEENAPKVYGIDKINEKEPIYIVEGPFDSHFLDNSVAMVGADLDTQLRLVGAIIFGFLITNLVTEKSSTESQRPLIEGTSSHLAK